MTDQIGEILPADTFFLRIDVGEASLGDNEYELTSFVGSLLPTVRSNKTNKFFTLSWEDIIKLAEKAGVNED